MAVDRGGGRVGMLSQVAGAGSPARYRGGCRLPFPLLFSSWSSGYCLYESELCVRELLKVPCDFIWGADRMAAIQKARVEKYQR